MGVLLNMLPDHAVEPHLPPHLQSLRKADYATRTVRERRLTILRLARTLGHPLAEATGNELSEYQTARSELPLGRGAGCRPSPSSTQTEVAHLSMYFRWLIETGHRTDDPTRSLVRPKSRRRLPNPMPDDDIARAIELAAEPLRTWVCLAAFCGLRCCEIAPLQRDWIVAGPPAFLRVIGKGDKMRQVPLPGELLQALQSGPFNANGHLFDRMDGKAGPPSAGRVSDRINHHLHNVVGTNLTAHKLRHRYGTEMYRLTKDPFRVASYMGHSSVDTTRGYVLVADDESADLASKVARLRSSAA